MTDKSQSPDDRLQQEFDKITEQIHQLELVAFQKGDGFTEQQSEPAPIDEANQVTFPVDPSMKARAEAELKTLQSDLPLIMGDAPQLEQAFLNLMLNAAEAMPDGGTLTITSREIRDPRSSPHATHLVVEFKDTGKGMSAEIRKRAFTAVLSTTKAKGTGLGLAIVGRIIETHRGTIRIKSKIGRGTSLIITLPTQ